PGDLDLGTQTRAHLPVGCRLGIPHALGDLLVGDVLAVHPERVSPADGGRLAAVAAVVGRALRAEVGAEVAHSSPAFLSAAAMRLPCGVASSATARRTSSSKSSRRLCSRLRRT